ncbi:MAG: hypothetical protein PUB42_00255 [Firmicutes bacterium]|nr:hypothetical protein [Bacillota bacterium]
MYSFICAENKSAIPAISLFCDDVPLFSDLIHNLPSCKKSLLSGTSAITVYDNLGHIMHDLWMSFAPDKSYRLYIYDSYICIMSD